MGAGRHTKFSKSILDTVYRLALLGLTDKEMIQFFEIAEQTWYNWQEKNPSLTKALQKGRLQADSKVALANYKRAIGYDYYEETTNVVDKELVVTRVLKHQPPHPTAFIFWLKNRTGRKHNLQEFSWRDVIQSEISGKNGGPIKTQSVLLDKIDLSDLTEEELQIAEKLGMKIESARYPKKEGE